MFIINSNDTNYVVKILVTDDGIVCHIFDFKNYYQESLSRFTVLERAREQNPLFEADSKLVFSTLTEQPSSHTLQNDKNVSSHLKFLTKYQLKVDELDFPFKFEWNLKLCSTDEFSQTITMPLIRSLLVHQTQVANLKQIIEKKDAEIAQYKQEGGVLIRKTVSTTPFNSEQFDQHYNSIANIADTFNFHKSKEMNELFKPVFITDEINMFSPCNSRNTIENPESPNSVYTKFSPSKKKNNLMLQKLRKLNRPTTITKLKYDNDESETENSASKRTRTGAAELV